jgi:hypothetical protein
MFRHTRGSLLLLFYWLLMSVRSFRGYLRRIGIPIEGMLRHTRGSLLLLFYWAADKCTPQERQGRGFAAPQAAATGAVE